MLRLVAVADSNADFEAVPPAPVAGPPLVVPSLPSHRPGSRSPISQGCCVPQAVDSVGDSCSNPSNSELDEPNGKRKRRGLSRC
jgi:hypothetical protein